MPDALPLVRFQGGAGYLEATTAVNGTCNDITLVARQTGVTLALVASDTAVDGSQYLWESALLPVGRQVYFEANASGISLGAAIQVMVSLYTVVGGVLVPNSALTISSTTSKRLRSTVPLTLIDQTEYIVRYRTPGLLGTAFLYNARFIIR